MQGIWGTIIPSSTSGNQLATLLNDMKLATVSGFSGTARPTNLEAGGYWIDVTNAGSPNYYWEYKVWTGTVDIPVFRLNLQSGLASIGNTDNLFQISRLTEDAVAPILNFLKERTANNGQTLNGDSLGEIHITAAASDNSNPIVAKMKFISLDDATSSASGAYWSLEVTPDGTNALAEVLRVIDGKLGVGTTAPANTIHANGSGIRSESIADSTTGGAFISRKKRVTGSGQVLSGDSVGEWSMNSTDEAGAEIASVAAVEAYALENHSTTAEGTGVRIKVTGTGETSKTTAVDIKKSGATFSVPVVATDVTTTNLYATNYYTGNVQQIVDPQIELNQGGNEATAQAAKAGIKVTMSDATAFVMGFDNTKASEVVAGRSGAEKELINVDSSQTLSNKKFTTLALDSQDIATATDITTMSTSKAIVRFTGSTVSNLHGLDATGTNNSKAILLHNDSSANVTLVHNSATETTATNRLSLPGSASIVLAAGDSIELFYEVNIARWKQKSGSGTGSGGSSGINYVLNPDGEIDTTGWAAYADSGASPTDGSGGSPNVTITRSTSSPLRKTASFVLTKDSVDRQGQGISYDFTIDAADQAKVLQGSFDYALGGTYADDDLAIWIYDVTNAALIQPAPYLIKNHSMPSERMFFEFQTASNSVAYRLIIHCKSTSASAYTMKFDNVVVGPQAKLYGSPVLDATNYTPIFEGLGTVTGTTASWKKVGDFIEVMFRAVSGTNTAALVTISLPSWYSVDTSKIGSAVSVGDFSTTATPYSGTLIFGTSTPTKVYIVANNASSVAGSSGTTWANGTTFGGSFKVPILGWSSSTIMSSDANTQVVASRSTRNGTSLTGVNTNASFMKIPFTTAAFDKGGIFSSANSRFEIKSPGVYVANAKIWISGTNSLNSGYFISIFKNGSEYSRGTYLLNPTVGNQLALGADARVECVAGDYLEVYMYGYGNNSASTLTVEGGTGLSYFEVSKISGPTQIASSENVTAIYSSSAGQSIANGATQLVDFATKVQDSHNSVTTGASWKFTAPISGLYLVNARVRWGNNLSWSAGQYVAWLVYKNGSSQQVVGEQPIYATGILSSAGPIAFGETKVRLLAGEYIDLRAAHGESSARALLASAAHNYIEINRIGNY